jgi:uncharacterized protein
MRNIPFHLPKECAFDKTIGIFYAGWLRSNHQYLILGHEEEVQHIEGVPSSQIQREDHEMTFSTVSAVGILLKGMGREDRRI